MCGSTISVDCVPQTSTSLAEQVEISLYHLIVRVNLESSFILRDGLGDALEFAKGISSSHSHSQVHLLETFEVWSFRVEPTSEVFDQADGLIALRHDPIELVLGEEAGDFVDIDANIVQSSGLSGHSESLLVEFERLGKLLLLEQLIRFVLILAESDDVKLFLDKLQGLARLRLAWLQKHDSVQIDLGLLVVLLSHVGFRPAKEQFALEGVLSASGERLGLGLEHLDDFKGLRRRLDCIIVVVSHHVDESDVAERVLVRRILLQGLVVLFKCAIKVLGVEKSITLELDLLRRLSVPDNGQVVLQTAALALPDDLRVNWAGKHFLEVSD